jgi:hypothetical protein
VGPLSNWGAMSTQDGPSRTLVAWTRWLAGWLDDERVACFDVEQIQDHGSFDIELVPLDIQAAGHKAVIVRTGEHSGFVIESRRPLFPDHDLVYYETLGRDPYGVIVYRVDATKGNADGTLIAMPPDGQDLIPIQFSGRMDNRVVDALYNVGATGVVDGVRIELVHSGARDVVRLTGS